MTKHSFLKVDNTVCLFPLTQLKFYNFDFLVLRFYLLVQLRKKSICQVGFSK